MGNVNMEARQVHVRDNNKKTWRTVADALKALEASGASVAEDITELYTRDASRANKDDIANEFSAEQAYYTGDYVYYQGSLFKFTAFHAAGEWSSEDVVPAQIGKAIADFSAAVDYSTTEQTTGQKWIDGKDIYFKTYNAGALPASGNVTITHNISNFGHVVNVETVGVSNDGYSLANGGLVMSYADTTTLVFHVTFDASGYNGYVTVYYTKSA